MYSLKRFFLDAFVPAICVLGIAYNFLVALNGEEGIRARALYSEKVAEKAAELDALQHQREVLTRKSYLLSLRTLDKDMLDESSRRVLGYAAEGEYVISIHELDRLLQHTPPSQK
jgi:cell division protein FtsB